MNGLFITFEGGEGSGKSTQIERLEAYLKARSCLVVTTREPGGPPISEMIRSMLLDLQNTSITPTTELLLYEAARAQHVQETIRPAMEAGAVVLCDRFCDSTKAYQGAGRGLRREDLELLHGIATGGLVPDLTFLIDIPVEEGLRRAGGRGRHDRIEQESMEFHEAVRNGFLALAQEEPERIEVIDGALRVEVIAERIASRVDRALEGRDLSSPS